MTIVYKALRRIGAIYAVEEPIRGKPPDELRRVRQAQALPSLDELKCWFEVTLATLIERVLSGATGERGRPVADAPDR